MIEAKLPCSTGSNTRSTPGKPGDNPSNRPNQSRVRDVNMRNLVVRHGKRARLGHIEKFTAFLDPHRKQSLLAQCAIDMNGSRDWCDAVFGQHDHASPVAFGIRDQIARHRIDLRKATGYFRCVRAEALKVVVQMRQVDEGKSWRTRAPDVQGSIGDPARAAYRCRRSPELKERKDAELFVSSARSARAVCSSREACGRRICRSAAA